jgi:hypothetical protein
LDNFQYLVEKNGIPENPVFLESDFFKTYHGRLPASLLDFWNSLGLGECFGGLLRFVDPRDYSPILDSVPKRGVSFLRSRRSPALAGLVRLALLTG